MMAKGKNRGKKTAIIAKGPVFNRGGVSGQRKQVGEGRGESPGEKSG